jgi:hypothetical protein
VAVDASGNAYVLGAGSGNVFRIGPQGVVREIFDPVDEGLAGRVDGLDSIAVDTAGSVYVTASATHNALRIHPRPVVEIIRASGDGVGHALRGPTAIATDAATRDVIVVGSGSSNAFRITAHGNVERVLDRRGDGRSPCFRPVDVATDAAGNVYVACEESGTVFRVPRTGRAREILASGAPPRAAVDRPRRLAADAAGNVYVGAASGLFRVSPSGEVEELPHRASGARFGGVAGLAVDAAANVYVSTPRGNHVDRVSPSGRPLRLLNGSGDGTHPLDDPAALAVDAAGRLYVVGRRSHNVFRVGPSGAVRLVLDATGDRSWLHLRGVPRRGPGLRR